MSCICPGTFDPDQCDGCSACCTEEEVEEICAEAEEDDWYNDLKVFTFVSRSYIM